MQIYLTPYKHKTYTNVPYKEEKQRNDGTKNHGFMDLKKYPAKIRNVPELNNNPELKSLIETINKNTVKLATFGCDISWDPLLMNSGYHEVSSYINIFNHGNYNEEGNTDNYWLNLVGDFLKWYSKIDYTNELVTVEWILNPTNFHNPSKIEKGSSPKEETVEFRNFSLNLTVKGFAGSPEKAVEQWAEGVYTVEKFFNNE